MSDPSRRLNLPLSGEASAAPDVSVPPNGPGASLEERVVNVLHTVYDPEIPVDIYELGLVYDLNVDPSGAVAIRMTLTSPGCPVAGSLPGEVESKVKAGPGVTSAKVELGWEPPCDQNRMAESDRLQRGFF